MSVKSYRYIQQAYLWLSICFQLWTYSVHNAYCFSQAFSSDETAPIDSTTSAFFLFFLQSIVRNFYAQSLLKWSYNDLLWTVFSCFPTCKWSSRSSNRRKTIPHRTILHSSSPSSVLRRSSDLTGLLSFLENSSSCWISVLSCGFIKISLKGSNLPSPIPKAFHTLMPVSSN